MSDTGVLVSRTYSQVRRQQCLVLLNAFIRRWGVYLLVVACIAGIGAPALAAWSVLPLFWALSQPHWLVPVLLLYALFGALPTWYARAMLWPLAWAEIERAMPISLGQLLWSDLEVVTLALIPLSLLFAAGSAVLFAQDPAWLQPHRAAAIGALLLVLSGSTTIAIASLQGWRRTAALRDRARRRWPGTHAAQHGAVARVHWIFALFWAPLLRGTARGTAQAVATGFVALGGVAFVTGASGDRVRWGMAAFAALTMVVVSRTNALSRRELGPLLEHGRHLPIAPATLERARASVALAPVFLGLIMLWIATASTAMRPLVWWSYVAASCISGLIEVFLDQRDDAARITRRLVCAAVQIALGTEVVA